MIASLNNRTNERRNHHTQQQQQQNLLDVAPVEAVRGVVGDKLCKLIAIGLRRKAAADALRVSR
jgi:hypothetical protein